MLSGKHVYMLAGVQVGCLVGQPTIDHACMIEATSDYRLLLIARAQVRPLTYRFHAAMTGDDE
ncbi:MAG: hypothetical protein KDB27_21105 [Planctomycetales bacterium]|nr:hypothetical protein [Planctomycetales bacterium]